MRGTSIQLEPPRDGHKSVAEIRGETLPCSTHVLTEAPHGTAMAVRQA